jgi:hypothetical protein
VQHGCGVQAIPRDLSGNYTLPLGTIVKAGDTVLVSQHNPAMLDIAAGLTASLPRDGSGGMSGPLDMGSRRVTNMADGVALGDAATVRQAQLAVKGPKGDPGAKGDSGDIASQIQLDGVGRFIPNGGAVDNAVTINAALANAAVKGVYLAAGDYRVDTVIIVPSGKFLIGAGSGVTKLNRANLSGVTGNNAIVRTAANARGVVIRGFTATCPLNNHAFDGIHMRTAYDFLVEDVEVFNASYSFWAQEYAERGTFRNCRSWNANVHCETTQAYKITFDGIVSGTGAGTNPAGCEAVWHTLLASRDITFRNCFHTGIGISMLVVANDVNSDPQGGLITRIRYENCRSTQTDDKFALFVSKINGLVGRVDIVDCDVNAASILAQVQTGEVRMQGGEWKSPDKTGFIVYDEASLDWDNPRISLMSPPNDFGAFFSGPVRICGGVLTANSQRIGLGDARLRASYDTRLIRPGGDLIFNPALGMICRYTYPADFGATGDVTIGGAADNPVTGMATFNFIPSNGAQYRMRFRGKIKKTDANPTLRIYIENGGSFAAGLTYGSVRMKKADGTWAADNLPSGVAVSDAALNDVREFEMDLTFYATDNGINVMQGADGSMLLKGAQVTIERIA